MTPSSSMHLDFNSFLAWQRIQFGDNPAGSKGFSHTPCRAFQGMYNKDRSTRCGHSLSATPYIPHSPVSSHSSVRLHSSVNSQLCKITQPSAPPSHSSVAILRDLTQNSQHYLRNALSTQEIVHKNQYTSHLKEVSAKTRLQQLFLGRFFSLIMAPLSSRSYYTMHR